MRASAERTAPRKKTILLFPRSLGDKRAPERRQARWGRRVRKRVCAEHGEDDGWDSEPSEMDLCYLLCDMVDDKTVELDGKVFHKKAHKYALQPGKDRAPYLCVTVLLTLGGEMWFAV